MKNKLFRISALLAATGMVLAACGASTPPTPVTIIKEVIKEVPKEVQVVVTKETVKEVIKEVVKPVADRTTVKWYCCLGTGDSKDQQVIEKAWVDQYNKSQDKYNLVIEIVANAQAQANLKAQLAAGQIPDIVGPVGKAGRAAFRGSLLDVTPLIKKYNIDLSKFDANLLNFVKDDNLQVGLPYALFPAVTYYNKDIFDEAKMAYPPEKFGQKYKMPDGTERDWDVDTILAVAAKLTVDKNGKDSTQAGFDPKSTRTWGFDQQWASARSELTLCGAGDVYQGEGKPAKVPENWADCAQKIYDAMWKQGSYANGAARGSELLANPNEFASGNTAMTYVMSWYLCCIEGGKLKPNRVGFGIAPSYKGKITAKIDGDTFSIMKDSKVADAAFNVMIDMQKSKELEKLYNGLPSADAERQTFFKTKQDQFKMKAGDVNWQVFLDAIPYANVPHHETWLPNYVKSEARLNEFRDLMRSKAGLDIKAEVTKLETDLTKIFAEK